MSNADDIRGLPTIRSWAAGWPLDFYGGLIRQGYPVVPCTMLWPFYPPDPNGKPVRSCDNSYCLKQLVCTPETAAVITAIDLRFDNLSEAFVQPAYRLPLTEENRLKSPLVWSRKAGQLDDERIADALGPDEVWSNDGWLTGGSLFVRRLLELFPNLESLTLVDNNESSNDGIARYLLPKSLEFRPEDELTGLSLRFRDWRAEHPGNVNDVAAAWFSKRRGKYTAWIDGFEGQLPAGLRDVRLIQYGAAYDARNGLDPTIGYSNEIYGDGGSMPFYNSSKDSWLSLVGNDSLVNVFDLLPVWECLERRNPRAVRELSIYISPGAVMAGPEYGYRLVAPWVFEGYCQFLLWAMKGVGTPVSLRWYSKGGPPDTPMFWEAPTRTDPGFDLRPQLDALGGTELRDLTIGDYFRAAAEAGKTILNDPALLRFFEHGERVVVPGKGHPRNDTTAAGYPNPAIIDDHTWCLLECSANPPRETWERPKFAGSGAVNMNPAVSHIDPATGRPVAIKVWAMAFRIGTEYLVYSWSPCDITGPVTVTVPGYGPVELPGACCYFIFDSAPPPPPPPPEPQPVEVWNARINGVPAVIELMSKVDQGGPDHAVSGEPTQT